MTMPTQSPLYPITPDVMRWWIALERVNESPRFAGLRFNAAQKLSVWWSIAQDRCETEDELRPLWDDPKMHRYVEEWWKYYTDAGEALRLLDPDLTVADALWFSPEVDSETGAILLNTLIPVED